MNTPSLAEQRRTTALRAAVDLFSGTTSDANHITRVANGLEDYLRGESNEASEDNANLGLATTNRLFEELIIRFEIIKLHGQAEVLKAMRTKLPAAILEYRTVDS